MKTREELMAENRALKKQIQDYEERIMKLEAKVTELREDRYNAVEREMAEIRDHRDTCGNAD